MQTGSTQILHDGDLNRHRLNAEQPGTSIKPARLAASDQRKNLGAAAETAGTCHPEDFASSALASDMMNVDRQIVSEVTNIQSLSESQHLYEGEEAIEVKHQVLAAKRLYRPDG